MRKRYGKASKKQKTAILKELVATTGYQHLLQVSAFTMDRWRRALRQPRRKHHSGTQRGSLLKHQIPIRTFADWNDKRPGFGEIDLVQHDGGTIKGDFAQTLNFTDVATSWTEPAASPNKAKCMSLRRCKKSARVCLFRAWALIRTMARNLSMLICGAIAFKQN